MLQGGFKQYHYARPGFDDSEYAQLDFDGDALVFIGTAEGDPWYETTPADVAEAHRFEGIAFGKWTTGEVTSGAPGNFLDPLATPREVHYVVCELPEVDRSAWEEVEYVATYATTPTAQVGYEPSMVLASSRLTRDAEDLYRFNLDIKLGGLDYSVVATGFKRGVSQSGTFEISRPSEDPDDLLLLPSFRAGYCGKNAEYAFLLGRFKSSPGKMNFTFLQIFAHPDVD